MRLLSAVGESLWLNPAAIVWKIAPTADLNGAKAGDWDIDRRYRFQATAKFRAIKARFQDGADWLDTDLFRDAYTRRLATDGHIGRFRTIKELAENYEQRFVSLHRALKRDGFLTQAANGRKFALPHLLVGRDGEVMIGNQGNHRLAIAQVLGLERFAGRIVCRHLSI